MAYECGDDDDDDDKNDAHSQPGRESEKVERCAGPGLCLDAPTLPGSISARAHKRHQVMNHPSPRKKSLSPGRHHTIETAEESEDASICSRKPLQELDATRSWFPRIYLQQGTARVRNASATKRNRKERASSKEVFGQEPSSS
ncbi:hypothetical protein diail_5665 [Diaporthe ilicicola]|nr:hypothetical protein diail_5665 [Diaporthe ilicicola]